MNKITVLLAEDHTLVREGLRQMIELEADMQVVGEAEDGRQAVELAKELRPSVVLMDIAMPRLNGVEATRHLLAAVPDAKVIILSAHTDEAYVEHAVASGAVGFLLKQNSIREVCSAIRLVLKGKAAFSSKFAGSFGVRNPRSPGAAGRPAKNHSQLTSREMEVLQLIAEGFANKQVAAELAISIKTVEKHRAHLMEKLGIHDTAGLTRHAISAGVIESSVQLNIVPEQGA